MRWRLALAWLAVGVLVTAEARPGAKKGAKRAKKGGKKACDADFKAIKNQIKEISSLKKKIFFLNEEGRLERYSKHMRGAVRLIKECKVKDFKNHCQLGCGDRVVCRLTGPAPDVAACTLPRPEKRRVRRAAGMTRLTRAAGLTHRAELATRLKRATRLTHRAELATRLKRATRLTHRAELATRLKRAAGMTHRAELATRLKRATRLTHRAELATRLKRAAGMTRLNRANKMNRAALWGRGR